MDSVLKVAQLFYRSSMYPDQAIGLSEDIFPAITGYFLSTKIKKEEKDNAQLSKCVIIADGVAISQFRNWDCGVKIVRLFYPNTQYMHSHVLYIPLNDLYEQNPHLKEEDVISDLENILQSVIKANVIQKADISAISIYFKSHAWYGFINFSENLDESQMAFVYTWIKENNFQLPLIRPNERINVRYARKDSRLPNFQTQN